MAIKGDSGLSVEDLSEIRDNLLTSIKKNDTAYRSAYVDAILDFFNEGKKRIEPEKIRV